MTTKTNNDNRGWETKIREVAGCVYDVDPDEPDCMQFALEDDIRHLLKEAREETELKVEEELSKIFEIQLEEAVAKSISALAEKMALEAVGEDTKITKELAIALLNRAMHEDGIKVVIEDFGNEVKKEIRQSIRRAFGGKEKEGK